MKIKVRSCIYCGKELKKDEQCTCPTAVAKRMAHTSDTNNTKDNSANSGSAYSYSTKNNTYHTGYTKKENPIKSAWRTYLQRKKAARANNSTVKKPLRRNLIFDMLSFIKSPVTTVYNPGEMSVAFILLISAISGIFTSFGIYTLLVKIINGAATIKTGSLNVNMVVSGINGVSGAAIIAVIGAVFGMVFFLVCCAGMYFVSRAVFKYNMRFWEFASKLVLCPLAVSVSGILAIVFGMFSTAVFLLIILCGTIASFVLTYEALRSIWNTKTPNQVLYGMLLSILIVGVLLSNIVWII